MFSKFTLLILLCLAQSLWAGGESGGGGDASEERVNAIRTDILSWIQKGGAKGLTLPSETTYEEYSEKMIDILQPQKVIVGFIEHDHASDDELSLNVGGLPKTCRGFISKKNSRPHILCQISRFRDLSDEEQYKLIHHEYAGLARVEKNEKAASDYSISSQLSLYLENQTVKKLSLKASCSDCSRNDDVYRELFEKAKPLKHAREIFKGMYDLKHGDVILTMAHNNINPEFPYSLMLMKFNERGFSEITFSAFRLPYPDPEKLTCPNLENLVFHANLTIAMAIPSKNDLTLNYRSSLGDVTKDAFYRIKIRKQVNEETGEDYIIGKMEKCVNEARKLDEKSWKEDGYLLLSGELRTYTTDALINFCKISI